jgi:diadenylate cyclase
MSEFLAALTDAWGKLTLVNVLDIAVVAALIYQLVVHVRGRRAAQIMSGLLLLLMLYLIAVWAGLQLVTMALAALAPYTAFVLIVLFQSEIRRALARIGRRRWLGFEDRREQLEAADEILLAIEFLSQRKTGALIVVEREIGLRSFIETGVPLDAKLSRDLLISIFYPGTPLHDGAAIVQGDRVVAAACFLPLTVNPNLVSTMGTRHRAAIGITEETDCLSIIVSEETGRLSYAIHGELIENAAIDQVEHLLTGRRAGRWRSAPAERRSAVPR